MKWTDIESANGRPTWRRLIKLCWTPEQSKSKRLTDCEDDDDDDDELAEKCTVARGLW